MNIFHEDQVAWLAQVDEDVIDADRPIIDPHHHLWPDLMGHVYNVDDYARDTDSGHRIIGSVFMECSSCYREDGPEHLKPLGETEYVLAQAARVAQEDLPTPILGMVGHVDLSDGEHREAALDGHLELAGDFFKGIRHAGACSPMADREQMVIPWDAPDDLFRQSSFREGVKALARRDLSFDSWFHHFQLGDYLDLAHACPDTVMVMDHFACPLGVGSFAGRHDEIFPVWRKQMDELARCENVFLKVGGLAMPDNGFGWHLADRPPTSDELLDTQGRWYHHALDRFVAERCMFESNFPVDRTSLSYRVYYNAMKTLVAGASESEKTALFTGTAARVYRLPLPA